MFSGTQTYSVAQSELEPGENLLWTGTPDARRTMISNFAAWLFAIPWTAFSLFWMWGASGMKFIAWPPAGLPPNFGFALFGVPFVLIGFAMLLSPFLSAGKARRTTYAVTDRRVLIVESGKTKIVQSFSGKDIGEIKHTERANGSGDLSFARRISTDSDGDKRLSETKFVGISDVRGVDDLIRATFKRD